MLTLTTPQKSKPASVSGLTEQFFKPVLFCLLSFSVFPSFTALIVRVNSVRVCLQSQCLSEVIPTASWPRV